MDSERRSRLAGRDRGRRHGSGAVVPCWTVAAPRPRSARCGPLSRGSHREPLRRGVPPPRHNETLGHRGRKDDPLYKLRKLLLTGSEQLNKRGRDWVLLSLRTGDPNNKVVGAWLAEESVRDVHLAGNYANAAIVLDKAISGCPADEVAEIRSLGTTLAS